MHARRLRFVTASARSVAASMTLALATALPAAHAQAPEPPRAAASATAAATDSAARAALLAAQLERIADLRRQRPDDPLLWLYEELTRAQAGDAAGAVARLQGLRGRRSGIVPTDDPFFAALAADPAWDGLRRALAAEEPRTTDAPLVRRLRDRGLVPEGIAYDARRRQHLVGSIARRKVVAVHADGRERDFSTPADRLDRVLGLAVDTPRDRLCAISTNGFDDPASRGALRNALVCWALADARRLSRVDVPEAQQLNDLSFDAQGDAFVTDSAAGSLWRLPRDGGAAQRIGAAGALRGANGVAVAGDGSGAVYVTLSTGIARVDLVGGTVARLPQASDGWVTGGIDGLYWHRGDLVGVQNGPNPGRVLRLRLGDRGTRIVGLDVLQSHHHPAFAEPTTGTLVGDALHVLANSHVGLFAPDGRITRPDALRRPAIVAVPLGQR
jgi:sugar lactone lactonase YvrE